MTLEQLKYFLALYDERSFTEVARNLFITQPALSNSISRLEGELGKKLFIRDGHSLTPTEFGADIAMFARRIIGGYDEMIRYINLTAGGHGGAVKLLCTPIYVDWILEQGMPLFLRRFMNVECSLEKVDNPDIFDLITSADNGGAALFAPTQHYLGLYVDLIEQNDLTLDIWLQSNFYAFVSKSHPWADRPSIPIEDIKEGSYIAYDGYRNKGISKSSKIVVMADGPDENQILTTDAGYIFQSILSGEKVGIFPGMCAINNFYVQHGFIKVIPFDNFSEMMYVGLLSRSNERPTENLMALESCLKQAARRSIERTTYGVELVTRKQSVEIIANTR